MSNTTFYIKSLGYRPLFFVHSNQKEYELGQISIYGKGKMLYTTRGWFEHFCAPNITYDIKTFSLPIKIKKALKLNLTRKDCFFLPSQTSHFNCWNINKTYNIFIHEKYAPIKIIGEKEYMKTDIYIHYHSLIEIALPVTIFEKGKAKNLDKFTASTSYRIEKTPFGEKVDNWANIFREFDINITSSEMAKILKNFRISPKNSSLLNKLHSK